MAARTHNVEEERDLAGRLAGVLFLTAGVSALVLLLIPGVEDGHRDWVIALAAACIAWGLFCMTLARPEEHGIWFWHAPALGSILFVTGVMAATGGADSPARFYVFFLLVYAAYFYQRHDAVPYVLSCVAVALVPLLYDTGAVGEGYIGELIVVCPVYVVLGLLIIKGKELLVSLREQAEALALLDALTELPNRRAMVDWLGTELQLESPTGLILVDLDGFKDVNTAHGYPAGDAVLCDTAARLCASVRPDDVVARLGGDEFAILAPGATPEAMGFLAERTLASLRGLRYDDVSLSASVGWVIYPDDAGSVDELIAAADFCLRGAKLTGKDRAVSALDWAPDLAA
ncbi:MAG TPA: GGDEF domain-containing protein [Thermoleophilaceae bacterium]|nr:GGDEF domain-containing protein [Thermoleophilaceae bacterium]